MLLPPRVSQCHFLGKFFHVFINRLGFPPWHCLLASSAPCSLNRLSFWDGSLYRLSWKPWSLRGVVDIFTSCSFVPHFAFGVSFRPNICGFFLFCFCKLKWPVISLTAWVCLGLERFSHPRHCKWFSKIPSKPFYLLIFLNCGHFKRINYCTISCKM